MDQYEDLGILRKVSQGTQTVNVVIKVDLELLRRDIEDEDQHSYILEDVVSLRLKVLLHEAILTTTIPQGEHKVAKDALGSEHVLEQVRPEVRMDLGSAYRNVPFCVNDSSRRCALMAGSVSF